MELAVNTAKHICYTAPHNAIQCRGLQTPHYNDGRLYPIRCGCSRSFDVWLLLSTGNPLLHGIVIDILSYSANWAHHQNLSIHLQRHHSIDGFLRYFLRQSPMLTKSIYGTYKCRKVGVKSRKQKQYWPS